MSSRPAPPPIPHGDWVSVDPDVGVRVARRRVRFRGSVEQVTARLTVDPSGAATLAATVAGRQLFELRFDAGRVTCCGDAVELDGLLTLGPDPVQVVARGSLAGSAADEWRLSLETVFDRRQLGLGWDEIDDEVTLYADLRLRRDA